MSDLKQAAQQALEALDGVLDTYGEPLDKLSIAGGTYEALYCRDAITALRAALAEPTPFQPDWSLLEATQESLREHMEEVRQLREQTTALDAKLGELEQVEPVASVTECEACFTPDVCQLRGTCDHYAAERLRVAAPPQREPLTDEQVYEGWADGDRQSRSAFEDGVRYAERAHGIGGKE